MKKLRALTNGCFDILHVGHIRSFQYIKSKYPGVRITVAINSDESIRNLKGSTRPINNVSDRLEMLNSLKHIAGVVVFNDSNAANIIERFKPDIYFKSGDYTYDTLHPEERYALKKVGAEIVFVPFVPNYSTTSIINRINEGNQGQNTHKNNLVASNSNT